MRIAVIRGDGLLDLGDEAKAAGYLPGVYVQVVRLSTGHLLLLPAEEQPGVMDLSALKQMHGRRALPRLRTRVDKEPRSE